MSAAVAVEIAELRGELSLVKQHAEMGEAQIRERWAASESRFQAIEDSIAAEVKESHEFREEIRIARAITDGKVDTLTAAVTGQQTWAQAFKEKPWPFLVVAGLIVGTYLFQAGHIDSVGTDILGSKVNVSGPNHAPILIEPTIESDGTDWDVDSLETRPRP